ncbi:MAG: hypothetical protein KDC53_18235 [Saprospiraceae bacterium]|nr:hypothetical protein [Saprospiraceae bacterium]
MVSYIVEKSLYTLLVFLTIASSVCIAQGFDYGAYGKELATSENFKKGRLMDISISGNTLFAIGEKSLYSFDISVPKNPVLLDSITGLGSVRQMVLQNGFAYITSREDGMYIVDVQDPGKMLLASHYDAIEFATGIAVSGNIAVLTNRIYGIELVNISNPFKPVYLSHLLTDEAQSVSVQGHYVFVGDWASKKVIIIDIGDPSKPMIVSDVMVDGYPDGIFARESLCFVATGHHGMQLIHKEETDPAWGRGHGFEIIDISNIRHPKVISRLKLPAFYLRSPDWWDVQVSGQYAIVADSKAGLFIINVSDAQKPYYVGHAKLETPGEENVSGLINGFALGRDVVYVAGMTGLYVVEAKDIVEPLPDKQSLFLNYKAGDSVNDPSIYYSGTQIHAVAIDSASGSVLMAAGSGGVHKASIFPNLFGYQILDRGHEVYDIDLASGNLYLAEGLYGLTVWEFHSGQIGKQIGSYKPANGGVYQMVIDNRSGIAALQVNNSIQFVNISDPKNIIKIFEDRNPHLMYRNPISEQIFDSRYFGSMWLGDCYLYEILEHGKIEKKGKIFSSIGGWNVSFGPVNGFMVVNNQSIAICNDALIVKDSLNAQTYKSIEIDGMLLSGKPTLSSSILYCSDKRTGFISAFDISNLYAPKKQWQRKIEGNPGYVISYKDMLMVPAGNGGLQILKANNGTPYFN